MNLYAKVNGKLVVYEALDDVDQVQASIAVAKDILFKEHGVSATVLCVVPNMRSQVLK